MELRNESIFIDNLTKKEKENIEKAIKEVKPDIYIFDQSNSMTLNFDEDFLKHEIEFYRKYNEPQKKEAMAFILSKFEDACVDGKFGEIWTLPSNPSDSYLECNGQAVDSTKYPKLYTLMHNTPDYRGVFLRGLGGNSASLGVTQGDAIRNITGTMGGSNSIDVGLWDYGTGVFYQFNQGRNSVANGRSWYSYVSQGMSFDASRVVPTAEENRPVNKAVRYFIKAK